LVNLCCWLYMCDVAAAPRRSLSYRYQVSFRAHCFHQMFLTRALSRVKLPPGPPYHNVPFLCRLDLWLLSDLDEHTSVRIFDRKAGLVPLTDIASFQLEWARSAWTYNHLFTRGEKASIAERRGPLLQRKCFKLSACRRW